MPVVVVSPKYLGELKKMPDNVLSFDGAIEEVRLSSSHHHLPPIFIQTDTRPV